jgi:Putative transposase
MLHPHLHCIVPGGGINEKGAWVFPKKYSKNPRKMKYLFPKKAVSKVYRAKFMAALREEIAIPQNIAAVVMAKNWVVYAKRPFLSPKTVMEYLGRYTHKIAISNHRILDISNGKVTFKYKDYRANANKIMVLNATEFIRRFSLHILPKGFRKIRHYGMLASRNKATDLNKAKAFFNLELWVKQKIAWEDIAKVKLKVNPKVCQICKTQTMVVVEMIDPCRGPPVMNKTTKPNYAF